MGKFITARKEVEAVQWRKDGDHPLVEAFALEHYFDALFECEECDDEFINHGALGTGTSRARVCPGSYIVTDGPVTSIVGPKEFAERYVHELDTGGSGMAMTGVEDGTNEAILELEVDGRKEQCFISPMFWDSIREHWGKYAGTPFEELLEEDKAKFEASLKASNARRLVADEDWAYFDDKGDVRCRICERQVSTKSDTTHECPGVVG